jgi:hypothetical protein
MRRAGAENASTSRGALGRKDEGTPGGIAIKPPDQPDAGKPGEVAQRELEVASGNELENVGFGLGFAGLMPRIEL